MRSGFWATQGDEEHGIRLALWSDRTGTYPRGKHPSSEIRLWEIGPHTDDYGIGKSKFPKIFFFENISANRLESEPLTFIGQRLASAPMASDMIQELRTQVRDVPDFPKKGIVFKDITPILKDGALFRASIDLFLERFHGKKIDKIVGIDARGFLFGSAVAYELGIGFVPLRKKGRLPYKTESAKYTLEYGDAEMELHIDAITPGEQIILIDDLLATGGTSASAATLIKKVGGELVEAIFLIELEFLRGREKLAPTPVISFLKY